MNQKILIALGVVVLAAVLYIGIKPNTVTSPPVGSPAATTDQMATTTPNGISWQLMSAGERDGMPQTKVSVTIDGIAYEAGIFTGSCSEVTEGGGIDGTGLLIGELSAMQCWYAGSGDEIGVFAHEDGGYQIMVGELGEGTEGAPLFRGNFEIIEDIE